MKTILDWFRKRKAATCCEDGACGCESADCRKDGACGRGCCGPDCCKPTDRNATCCG